MACLCRLVTDWQEENPAPETVSLRTHEKYLWNCQDCGRTYKSSPAVRYYDGAGCPICARKSMQPFTRRLVIHEQPNLAEEYNHEANLRPFEELTCGSDYNAIWTCKRCGNDFKSWIANRVRRGSSCPQPDCRKAMRLSKDRSRSARRLLPVELEHTDVSTNQCSSV